MHYVYGLYQAKNHGSHANEGFKDIEEYAYSECEIRPIKIIFWKSESDPIPAQGQSTYWLVENRHNWIMETVATIYYNLLPVITNE